MAGLEMCKNTVKLTEAQADEVRFCCNEEWVEINGINYIIVDEGTWKVEPKGQYKEMIFCVEGNRKDGPFFKLGIFKSGSDYTDWFYEYFELDCPEVVEKTKVVTKTFWKEVK